MTQLRYQRILQKGLFRRSRIFLSFFVLPAGGGIRPSGGLSHNNNNTNI
jgi:hypothetical protein